MDFPRRFFFPRRSPLSARAFTLIDPGSRVRDDANVERNARQSAFTLIDPGYRLRDDAAVQSKARQSGFTLIELLIVIAIIAILAIVVVLTLNPAQLLEQSRDGDRLSDMANLQTALNLFQADQPSGSMGSSSVIYVSIPDPAATSTSGSNCASLGLPSLPASYSYHCAASSTYRNVSGSGWIPVNFSAVSAGSPLSVLPQDPTNSSSSRLYYTYTTNGSQYELTANLESAKYKLGGTNDEIGPDGSTLSTVYAKGTNLSLEPLDYGDASLVGYWTMDEGTGTTAYDWSGTGNNGIWQGTASGTSGYYSAGKIGQFSGTFNGLNTYVTSSFQPASIFSIDMWFEGSTTAFTDYNRGLFSDFKYPGSASGTYAGTNNGNIIEWYDGNNQLNIYPGNTFATGTWYNYALVSNGSKLFAYINGSLTTSTTGQTTISQNLFIGRSTFNTDYWLGNIDDFRVYNRALSAAEVAAMYSGGK